MRRRLVICSVAPLFPMLGMLSGCATGNIDQSSQVSPNLRGRVESVLMVDSFQVNSQSPLGRMELLVGSRLKSRLTAAGVNAQSVFLARVEIDPKSVVERAVREHKPTHVMLVTVPSGMIRGSSTIPDTYRLQVELLDASTRAVVWKYVAEIALGTQALGEHVADAVLARMRQDRLF